MKKALFILLNLLAVTFLLVQLRTNKVSASSGFKFNMPQLPFSQLKSGDLIFRDGRGFISSIFRKFSQRDPRYSHAGILHREGNTFFVYHITGHELNNNDKVRKDLLSDFIRPDYSSAFGIYRTELNGEKIDSLAGICFNNQIRFDSQFNLKTNDRQYCTELVYKIIDQVSQGNNFIPLSRVDNYPFVSCDNIYLAPTVKKIFSYQYER